MGNLPCSSANSIFPCTYSFELYTGLPETCKDFLIPIYPWLDFYILLPHKFFVSNPVCRLSLQPDILCSVMHLWQPGTLHFPGWQPSNLQHFLEKVLAIFPLVIFFTSVADAGRTKLRQFAPAIWLMAMPSKFPLTLTTSQNVAELFAEPGLHHCTNLRADFPYCQGFLTQPIYLHFEYFPSRKSHAFYTVYWP